LPEILHGSALLERFSGKDRDGFERQLTACRAKGGEPLATLWSDLAALFTTLASRPPKLTGTNTIQFFIPDGKHRQQVFAMHMEDDGRVSLYLPNVLDTAISAKVLGKAGKPPLERSYAIGSSQESLTIDLLDRDTINPHAYFKDMTGWNRKAICVTLPAEATAGQKKAVEQLAALAAVNWPVEPATK
jgi:hypothetical protein